MPERKGHFAPQNTFLDTIATRFDGTHSNFLLGSAQIPGTFPIVYCSDGFCELTGFPRAQLMQRCCSCQFLYGEKTNAFDRIRILAALQQQEEFQTEVILYKKNEEPFLCMLDIVPIKNDKNDVVMFLVSHKNLPMPDEDCSYSPTFTDASNSIHSTSSVENSDEPTFKQLGHRRRSRAVLYNLSENLEKKSNPGVLRSFTNRLFGRRKSALPEYKVERMSPPRFTILHFGTAKSIWDWWIMFVTIYVTIIIPYYAAVQSIHGYNSNATESSSDMIDHHANNTAMVFDILVEIVFVVDIILTFRTTYVSKTGWVVADSRKICRNYMRTWFFIDLIAALPVDTISHIFHVDFSAQPVPMLKTVRLLRFFRLYHKIERWTQYSAVMLTILMLMFGLVAHWLACIWFTIGYSEFQSSPSKEAKGVGWLYELSEALQRPFGPNGTGGPDTTSSYITSLYFTLSSLTSVGFGNVSANTNNEKIFSICVMTIGALMHALVFGNVTAIIQRMYAKRSQYDIKMRDLRDFIKIHRLSKSTKQRMINHFQNTWEANGGVNATEVLKDFPRDIQADVAMHIYKEFLNIPIFQRGSPGFRRYLSLHVHRRKIAPGEFVIYDGDPLLSVNLVCKGSLEVLQNDLVIGILGKGDLFGADVSAPRHVTLTSQADVKALAYCEIECVSLDGIMDVIGFYPDFAPSFIKDMRSDFSCYLWQCGLKEQHHETDGKDYDHDDVSVLEDWGNVKYDESCTSEQLSNHSGSEDQHSSNSFYISEDEFAEVSETTSLSEPGLVETSQTRKFTIEVNATPKDGLIDTNTLKNKCENNKFEDESSNIANSKRWDKDGTSNTSSDVKSTNKENKTLLSSRMTSLVHSLSAVFSTKSSKDLNGDLSLQDSGSSKELLRPSCFKKSLLSLQNLKPNNSRLERSASDVSTKRVTFSEDFQRSSPASLTTKKRLKRSVSIPTQESINKFSYKEGSRRHSDGDWVMKHKFYLTDECSIKPMIADKTDNIDSNTQTKENPISLINFDDNTVNTQLTENNEKTSSCQAAMISNIDQTSPPRASSKRRRRQRRKSNSPNTSARRKATCEEHASLSDTMTYVRRNGAGKWPQYSSDSADENECVSLESDRKCIQKHEYNNQPLIQRKIDCDYEHVSPLEQFYMNRLQQITSKMIALTAEVQNLMCELNQSVRERSRFETKNSMRDFTQSSCWTHSPSTATRSLNTHDNTNHHTSTPDLGVANSMSLLSGSSVPLCTVTSPDGEPDDVIIDYEVERATSGITQTSSKQDQLLEHSLHDPPKKYVQWNVIPEHDVTEDISENKIADCCHNLRKCRSLDDDMRDKFNLWNGQVYVDKRRSFPCSSLRNLSLSSKPYMSNNSTQDTVIDMSSLDAEEDANTNMPNSANYFIPIGSISRSTSSDIDNDFQNRMLDVKPKHIGRGNESGYISTSPTIQLRE